MIMERRVRRRTVMSGVARAAGALLAGPVLAGCDLSPVGALNTVRQYGIPQPDGLPRRAGLPGARYALPDIR